VTLGIGQANSTENVSTLLGQDDTPIEVFESVLRRLSTDAFWALVNSGVRDINDFLKLDVTALVGLSPKVLREISAAQKLARQKIHSGSDRLFQVVLDCLGTRARHALLHGRVYTFKEFMNLKPNVMLRWPNTGAKTIAEILDVQRRIKELSSTIAQCGVLDVDTLRKLLGLPRTELSQHVGRSSTGDRQASPTVVEHRTNEPASWSILRKTIPEIFSIRDAELDALWISAGEKSTGASIELPKFDVFLGITLDYLLELQISSEAFDTIVRQVASLVDTDKHLARLPQVLPEDQPIVSRTEVAAIGNFRIDSFEMPECLLNEVYAHAVHTWNDLCKLTERSILESLGLSLETLRWIRGIWRIKPYAQLAAVQVSGPAFENYSSFSLMVESLIESVVRNDRDKIIAQRRLGLLNGHKITYEELSKSLGITRERVRQISHKLVKKLKSRATLKRMTRFSLAVLETLKVSGGACLLTELVEGVRERLAWEHTPEVATVASLLELRDDLEVDRVQSIVRDPKHECIGCKVVVSAIRRLFDADKDEKSVAEVSESLISVCKENPECKQRCRYLKFSEGFTRLVASKTADIMVGDRIVFHSETWGARRGTLVQLVEYVLKSAHRQMHYSEVYEECKRLRPNDEQITERNVKSWLDKCTRLLLWDRGTYIHRNYVTIPDDLLAEIENWLTEKLNTGVPFFSVAGVWAAFEVRLRANGIPSETALYSCLRERGHQGLTYARYPYVMRNSPEVERLPVSIALEEFILDSGGLVSYQDIRSYAVSQLGISEQLLPTHLGNAPNVARVGKGLFVHVNNLKLESAKMEAIIAHARTLVRMHGHVSVEKVFSDKQVSCLTMGIDSPEMLYAALQSQTENSSIELPGYPQIQKPGHFHDNRGSKRSHQ